MITTSPVSLSEDLCQKRRFASIFYFAGGMCNSCVVKKGVIGLGYWVCLSCGLVFVWVLNAAVVMMIVGRWWVVEEA